MGQEEFTYHQSVWQHLTTKEAIKIQETLVSMVERHI